MCRAARSHVHHPGHHLAVPIVLAALLVLLIAALAAQHLAR
ncbi:MAG TPA: hypothetical protein VGI64_02180 [Streptosporangiaceae bacterium]